MTVRLQKLLIALRSLVCSCVMIVGAAHAASSGTIAMQFDLPADTAERSLKRLSEQSGLEVLFPTNFARSLRTNGVRGTFTAREALDRMLAGTGLVGAQDEKTGALTVKKEASSPKGRRVAAAEAPPVRPLAADKTPPPLDSVNDVVELSPFEVRADLDTGYRATRTMADTRLRTELKDVAPSVSVITRDFMEDVNGYNLEDLFVYTLGTEVSGMGGNFTGVSLTLDNPNYNDDLIEPTSNNRVGGLASADQTRDFFLTSLPLDGYNFDRMEVIRGPNGMLVGLGSPAGVANAGLIRADLSRDKTSLSQKIGSYGSTRTVLAVCGNAVQGDDPDRQGRH